MTSLALSSSRLKAILDAWRQAATNGDAIAAKCTALVCVFGDMTPSTLENQRGQAALQYMLEAKQPITNVAAVLSAESTLIIRGDQMTVTAPSMEGHTVSVVANTPEGRSHIQSAVRGKVVGAALKEFSIQEGNFAAEVMSAIREGTPGDNLIEAAPLIGELLFVKDASALGAVEKAAGLCSAVFRRYVRQLLEDQLTKADPLTLYDLREQLCQKLGQPNTIHGLDALDISEFAVAAGLTPCIFEKGAYLPQIQVSQEELEATTKVPLRGNVMITRYGTKNNGHTAFFARTLIVEQRAPSSVKNAYQFLNDVSDKVIASLMQGARLSDVHAQVMEFATAANATLAAHLPSSFGFSTGLLVLESRGSISAKGTAAVTDGMSFVIRVTLEGLAGDTEGDTYAMELADTVIIRNGLAELKTKVARKLSDVTYEDVGQVEAFAPQTRDLSKITRQGVSETVLVSRESQRENELRKLLHELHEEFLAAGGKKGMHTNTEELRVYEIGRLSYGEVRPFAPHDPLPPAECAREIVVQGDKKVVWLPICGQPAPFHIATISKVDVKNQGDQYAMTITFHTLQEANVGYKLNRTKVFLKELNYTAARNVFAKTQEAIQGVMQRIKNEDATRKRSLSSAGLAKLIIVPNSLRLPQVKMRPPVVIGRQNKGCVGNLELHQNGLRFSFLGGAPVDLLFDNIKHIIFQPAVNSICVIYHVTLKKSIEIGRKSATEVQFVAEVMESSEAATGTRRSYEEELDAEERDQRRIKETNKQFITFARAVEERSQIRTQLPTAKFFFDGVHARAMTTFKASREVLWAISDWPAFTQSVGEVEVVSLERVIPGGSTFDMSLIMKDYNKPVVTISSIPRDKLDEVKDWCLSARLYYMETTVNPNWKVTLKDIREDPEWDPWLPGDGWSVLNNEADSQDGEDDSDSESDSTYYEEEDEETDSDDSSWLEDEESDVESGDDSDDDSSVVSWDELERKAVEHDRKRKFKDDDDDDRPQRKRQRAAPGAAAPPPAAPVARSVKMPMAYGKSAVPPPRRF